MAFSSVSVVASSLTLKWYKRPAELTLPTEVETPDSIQLQEMLARSDAGALDRVVANLKDVGYQVLGKFESILSKSRLSLGRGSSRRPAQTEGYQQVASDDV